MKVKIKKPGFNIGNRSRAEREAERSNAKKQGIELPGKTVRSFSEGLEEGEFGVNVRNAETGIKLTDNRSSGSWWLREFPHELATGLCLMTFFVFMLSAAEMASFMPALLVGVAIYMGLTVLGDKTDVRFKYFAAAGITAALILAAILMRKYIGGGLGSIMNLVYDASEAQQAYIYKRFTIDEAAGENFDATVMMAVAWISALAGTIGALPSAALRRLAGLGVAAAAMIAFAYYGLLPAALPVIFTIAAIFFVMSRGGLLSAVPVVLAALIAFGAVTSLAPGENYAISRADENIRDRLALRSAYLETDEAPGIQNRENTENKNENKKEEQDDQKREDQEVSTDRKWMAPLVTVLLILALFAAAAAFFYNKYKARRIANRKGIDDPDPRTAIVAMFPYAVKWLGAGNIDVYGKNFASLADTVRHGVSEQYSNYFSSMYVLWREAAYSDHDMDDEKRMAMKRFVNDTEEMVRRGMNRRSRLAAALKYAL